MERLNGMRVIAAVSGGADSVALLLMLLEKRRRGEIALAAAHVEHGLREDASIGDMEFVRELCLRENVPLFVKRVNVPEYAEKCGLGTETAARILRFRFFDELLSETGFDRVALAHHADDQAETVLMHILRGSALNGARGMAFDTGKYVRPLLDVPKAELVRYLAERGETFRQDETNFIADNPRNALRQALAFYPGASAALGRFAKRCAEDDDALNEIAAREAENRIAQFSGGVMFDRSGLSAAVFGRIAASLLPDPDAQTVDRLRTLEGKTQIRGGRYAFGERDKLYLYFEPQLCEPIPLAIPGETFLPDGETVTVSEAAEVIRGNGTRQTVDAKALRGAVLRRRLDGDRIRPFGMKGTKLLSDYLTDRKVPKPLRDALFVLARGNEILWVPGVGLSEDLRADKNKTMYCIKIGRKQLC